jgi:hypothetical protein
VVGRCFRSAELATPAVEADADEYVLAAFLFALPAVSKQRGLQLRERRTVSGQVSIWMKYRRTGNRRLLGPPDGFGQVQQGIGFAVGRSVEDEVYGLEHGSGACPSTGADCLDFAPASGDR